MIVQDSDSEALSDAANNITTLATDLTADTVDVPTAITTFNNILTSVATSASEDSVTAANLQTILSDVYDVLTGFVNQGEKTILMTISLFNHLGIC